MEHDARVYVAARDEKKSMEVIDEMFSDTGRRAHFLRLDLSSLSSIEAAAAQFLRYLIGPAKIYSPALISPIQIV